MERDFDALERLFGELDGAATVEGCMGTLETLVHSLGFDDFSFLEAASPSDGRPVQFGHATARVLACAERYLDRDLSRGDPIVTEVMKSTDAVSSMPWFADPAPKSRGDTIADIIGILRDGGINGFGNVIVGHATAGRRLTISVGLRDSDKAERFDARFHRSKTWLRAAGLLVTSKWDPLRGAADPLTEAERAVVALLAGGLRPQQIAVTLGRSESTVRHQIRSARSRLGASSNAEAVAIAARQRMI